MESSEFVALCGGKRPPLDSKVLSAIQPLHINGQTGDVGIDEETVLMVIKASWYGDVCPFPL
jgi:hypothetical protein